VNSLYRTVVDLFQTAMADDPGDVGPRSFSPKDGHRRLAIGGGASKFPAAISSNHARISLCGTTRGSASDAATACVGHGEIIGGSRAIFQPD